MRLSGSAMPGPTKRHVMVNTPDRHYLTIWQSELQFIAGLAAAKGGTETGGDLFGTFSRNGLPILQLTSPPGPNSIQEKAHFRQDIDFFKKSEAFLGEKFGLQYLGNWHHHHYLGLKGPSRGDVRSTHSIASKNAYCTMCQFVTTFEDEPASGFPSQVDRYDEKIFPAEATQPKPARRCLENPAARVMARFVRSHRMEFIKIHTFLYLDAAYGQPIRCPLKMIHGMSPFRRALLRNPAISGLTQPYRYPMSQILIDAFESRSEPQNQIHKLPSRIRSQYPHLPENVREGGRVRFEDDLIILSLPVPGEKGEVLMAYSQQHPNKVEAVYFSQNQPTEKLTDLTTDALCFGQYTCLSIIYDRVFRLMASEASNEIANGSRETVESLKSNITAHKHEEENRIQEDISRDKNLNKEVL